MNYEVGIIAGDRTIDPISTFIIPGKDDGKVGIVRTRLPRAKDFKIIHATHTFMTGNKDVILQSLAFITTGHFSKN